MAAFGYIFLRQTIFQSQPNDFRLPQIEKSFAADRGNGLKMVYNKCLFSALKGYGAQGMDWGLWRPRFTADRFPPASYGRRRPSSPIS